MNMESEENRFGKKMNPEERGDSTGDRAAESRIDHETQNRIVRKISAVGIAGNILLSLFKLIAGIAGHSGAMLSDAVHSLSDVFATLIAFIGVKLAKKKADVRHPYGHDRFECVASLALGIILAATGIAIGMKAAMYLSMKKTGLSEEVYRVCSKWLNRQIELPKYNLKDIEQILSLMRQDKKNASGAIRCVLLQDLGAAMIDVEVSDNEIRDAMLRLGQ